MISGRVMMRYEIDASQVSETYSWDRQSSRFQPVKTDVESTSTQILAWIVALFFGRTKADCRSSWRYNLGSYFRKGKSLNLTLIGIFFYHPSHPDKVFPFHSFSTNNLPFKNMALPPLLSDGLTIKCFRTQRTHYPSRTIGPPLYISKRRQKIASRSYTPVSCRRNNRLTLVES